MTYKNKDSKYSQDKKDSTKAKDTTTMVPVNNKAPPLEGGHSTKNGGMWTLKHETISPKFYELPIKTQLKVDTSLYLKNFYNNINICLNVVTRIQEDLLPAYQYIKRHSDFE